MGSTPTLVLWKPDRDAGSNPAGIPFETRARPRVISSDARLDSPEYHSREGARALFSFTPPTASPTIVHTGSPCAASTSTVTPYASIPCTAADCTDASIAGA